MQQRFRCFPEMMVISGHVQLQVLHASPTQPAVRGCLSWLALHVFSFMASGQRGAVSPEVAFLLHHEAIMLPHRACGHRTAQLLSLLNHAAARR